MTALTSASGPTPDPTPMSRARKLRPVDVRTEWLPQSGHVSLHSFQRKTRRLLLREERTCHRCGRPVAHWRFTGQDVARPRCAGPDRQSCGALRAFRNDLAQQTEALARRISERRRKSPRRIKPKPFEPPAGIDPVDEHGPHAGWFDLDHARRCPHPHKQWWHTLEAADQIVAMMRAQQLPATQTLNSYLCVCGKAHVGNQRGRPR